MIRLLRSTHPGAQEHTRLTACAARERVSQRDLASAEYVKRLYNVDAANPLLYDMVINTGRLAAATAAPHSAGV